MTRTAVALALLAMCCGCGSDSSLGTVSGTVSYDGQPMAGVEVVFSPSGGGRPSVGFTDENGEYSVQYTPEESGALIGMHTVAVTQHVGEGEQARPIPLEYSQMEFEVKPGSNEFNIDIKSSP